MNQIVAQPGLTSYDVVIIGGAIYGSAVAWFLASNPDFQGKILVVERDPSYQFASTTHTNSCMRQQFSREINIKISRFAAQYVRNFRQFMGDDPRVPDLTLRSFGYMYMADNADFAKVLQQSQKVQAACGAGTRHLTPKEIAQAYPFYRLDDIIAANHNTIDEGYFDGNTMFDWWKRCARERGAEFIANEVVAMSRDREDTHITSVHLKSGETINCGLVVNASGPRASKTAKMAGIKLPVEPRKRYTFIFDAEQPLDRDLPLTIDPTGIHFRTDGTYYMAGCAPDTDDAVDYDDFDEDHSLWEEKVWPVIAHRIPQFEAIKLINSWVGHYAYNTLDANAIVGRHTRLRNFLFVNGFSGHGLQQSPAIGRGVSELIIYGEYRSLDLSPFSFARIEANEPLLENAVI